MNNPDPQTDVSIATYAATGASIFVGLLVNFGTNNVYLALAAGISLWTVSIMLTFILSAMPARTNPQQDPED